jgi:hypothetical protein
MNTRSALSSTGVIMGVLSLSSITNEPPAVTDRKETSTIAKKCMNLIIKPPLTGKQETACSGKKKLNYSNDGIFCKSPPIICLLIRLIQRLTPVEVLIANR